MVFTGSSGVREKVAVEIGGDSSGVLDATNSAEAGLASLGSAVTALGGALIGLAGVMGTQAVNAARAFEEQMIELEKVTNPETADKMAESIRDMATEIPLAHRELSDIAAQAGRLGVEGVDNIEEFTRVTSKMAVSTNLSANMAADAFARITQLTGVSVQNVNELGSAINALSNNMATSAREITKSILRSGAALKQFGITAEDSLALSAALNEVSESSARAGTRLRRVAQELMNPDNVAKYAEALGMTEEEFKAMREESPLEVIRQMTEAFAEGGESADILRKTFSTTSRQAIAALSNNIEGLNQGLELSNEQFENGTSLTEEFRAANSTFNAALTRTENKLRNVAIETGQQLIPYLTDLLEHVNTAIESFSRMNSETDGMAGVFTIAGLAIAGIVATIAGLISLIGGPAVAAIGAVIAVVSGLAAAWQTNFANIQGHTQDAVTRVEAILERLGPAIEAARGIINNLRIAWRMVDDEVMTILSALLDGWLGIMTTWLDAIVTFVTIVLQLLNGDFAGALETFAGFWKRLFNGILSWVSEWGDKLVAAIYRIVASAIEGAGTNLEDFLDDIPGLDIKTGSLTPDTLVSGMRMKADEIERRGVRAMMRKDRRELRIKGELELNDDGELVAKIDERAEENIESYSRRSNDEVRRGSYRGE